MQTLVARPKPEAVRQMEDVTRSYGSISSSGKAVLANSEADTKAATEKLQADKDTAKESSKKDADNQQRAESREREALIARDRHVRDPIEKVEKQVC